MANRQQRRHSKRQKISVHAKIQKQARQRQNDRKEVEDLCKMVEQRILEILLNVLKSEYKFGVTRLERVKSAFDLKRSASGTWFDQLIVTKVDTNGEEQGVFSASIKCRKTLRISA